ncbi:condensation domain-containing protein, partial [Janthinobacterium sp. GMG1]|uniref:condensation domain-containing protein n=1 Tax=Janthinobacterium sp. GMG1 TaxID=3096007 RepID=UPI002ACAD3DE
QRSLSYSPLFQVMLSLQNNEEESGSLPGLTVSSLATQQHTAQFDLMLNVEEDEDGLQLSWEYSTDLFDASTVARMADSFACLLDGALTNPQRALDTLPLMG